MLGCGDLRVHPAPPSPTPPHPAAGRWLRIYPHPSHLPHLDVAADNLPHDTNLHTYPTPHRRFVVESKHARQRRHYGWFSGMNPRLKDESFVLDAHKRSAGGPFVSSVGAGSVDVRLNVLLKVRKRGVDMVLFPGRPSARPYLPSTFPPFVHRFVHKHPCVYRSINQFVTPSTDPSTHSSMRQFHPSIYPATFP
eukprot:185873-Chlamydomonas_euryale.AAC.2